MTKVEAVVKAPEPNYLDQYLAAQNDNRELQKVISSLESQKSEMGRDVQELKKVNISVIDSQDSLK